MLTWPGQREEFANNEKKEKLAKNWKRILPTHNYKNNTSFVDLRPFWKSLSKIEVPKDDKKTSDNIKCMMALVDFDREFAFISRKEKCVDGQIELKRDFDGHFDFRVKNCTFARIVSKENMPISIDFVENGGVFELKGCTIDSPWYHPVSFFVFGIPFHIETDGEEVEYSAFLCRGEIRLILRHLTFDSSHIAYFLDSKTVLAGSTGISSVVIDA